ncbi:MAG: HEAT repeat domain-containing protein [Planctomycetota bacterium]
MDATRLPLPRMNWIPRALGGTASRLRLRCASMALWGTCAALCVAAPVLAAHGGQYRGPAPTPAGPGGPNSGDGPGAAPDDGAWSRWWEFNREPFLELKNAVGDSNSAESPDGDSFLKRGGNGARRNDLRPDPALVHDRVVPAIIAALEGQRDVDLITASLMALAKIGDRPGDDIHVAAVLRPWLQHANGEVQETAALALGILGDPDEAPLLVALAEDTREGRAAVGGGKVSTRTRAFATYGLGLLGNQSERASVRRFVVLHLAHVLEHDDHARPDVATAVILGLGLVPIENGDLPKLDKQEPQRPAASRQATLLFLLDLLDDARLEREVRALVPVALARLEDGASPSMKDVIVDALVPIVRGDRDVELQVRHGAVQALGLLGDDDDDLSDQRIRAALFQATAEGDRVSRYVSLVSLGRVAGRAGTGTRGAARIDVRSRLSTVLVRGQSIQRPWAALALGLLERAALAEGAPPSEGLRLTLRDQLGSPGSPSERGAIITALGLIGHREAGPDLMKWLDSGEFELRSQAAVALGMMRYEPAIPALMKLVENASRQPGVLRDAAIALAMMRHKPVVASLVSTLTRSSDLYVRASVARALAFVGDVTAVDPLLELLTGRRVNESTRAFSVIALGLICDKEPFPWNSKLAQDLGWFETPPTLHDPVRQKGVIDIF